MSDERMRRLAREWASGDADAGAGLVSEELRRDPSAVVAKLAAIVDRIERPEDTTSERPLWPLAETLDAAASARARRGDPIFAFVGFHFFSEKCFALAARFDGLVTVGAAPSMLQRDLLPGMHLRTPTRHGTPSGAWPELGSWEVARLADVATTGPVEPTRAGENYAILQAIVRDQEGRPVEPRRSHGCVRLGIPRRRLGAALRSWSQAAADDRLCVRAEDADGIVRALRAGRVPAGAAR